MKPELEAFPTASRVWLEALPADTQSLASNLFLAVVRQGVTVPREVCRQVALGLRERYAQKQGAADHQGAAKTLRIWRNLIDHPEQALAFAVDRIEWEELPREERDRRKVRSAAQHRDAWHAARRKS